MPRREWGLWRARFLREIWPSAYPLLVVTLAEEAAGWGVGETVGFIAKSHSFEGLDRHRAFEADEPGRVAPDFASVKHPDCPRRGNGKDEPDD